VTSRPFRHEDLPLIIELSQELWPDVRVTYGQAAWSSLELAYDDEWEAQLWFAGDRLVAWGGSSTGS
jgi:hypothetical protein